MVELPNEVFALRNGERFTIQAEQPTEGKYLAVIARTVRFPGSNYRKIAANGLAVEQAAIIACQDVDGEWQWVQLSAPTKEAIGNVLFDSGASIDEWYFLTLD